METQQHNIPELVRCCQSSSEREVHSDKCLHQESRKLPKDLTLHLKELEKEKHLKPKVRRTEIKVKVKTNEIRDAWVDQWLSICLWLRAQP